MSITRINPRLIACAAAIAVAASAVLLHGDAPASAQCNGGEYALIQSGTVGWVRVNGDRTVEWWAYVDGAYAWADSSSVGVARWQAEAEYIGAGNWASYAAWRTDVLNRSAAVGHTIVFQQHAVTEESVSN